MALQCLERMTPKLMEARYICRTFSNAPPKLQPAKPFAQFAASYDTNLKKKNETMTNVLNAMSREPRGNSKRARLYDKKQAQRADPEKELRAMDMERQIHRNWKHGDVYAPHDLSFVENQKWAKKKPRDRDVFDQLGINPLDEYKNMAMMQEYTTSMGRIKHRKETGLRAVNQRRISKAIRRAVGMGLIPSVHKHPEMLEVDAEKKNRRLYMQQLRGSTSSRRRQ